MRDDAEYEDEGRDCEAGEGEWAEEMAVRGLLVEVK